MRKFFSRKLWAKHLTALLLIIVCLLLSNWQWHRAHYSRLATPTSTPVTFNKLSSARDFLPPSSVGQKTVVSGTWQPAGRIVLENRPADGRKLISQSGSAANYESGNWVIDLLQLQDGTSVAVVRGWQKSDSRFPSATGFGRVSGIVQPAEDAPNDNPISAKPLITTKFLLNRSATDIRDGFIIETGSETQLQPVTPTRSAFTSNGLRTLNVFYTFNWIFFAILIFVIWLRIIRDEVSSAT